MILVSPTERSAAMLALGETSSLPEQFGVDVIWWANGAKFGLQRKHWRDLLASVGDGRLAREVAQAGALRAAWMAVEGKPRFTVEGQMISEGFGRDWTYAAWIGMLEGIGDRGMRVVAVKDEQETAALVRVLEARTRKVKHHGWGRGPVETVWGRPTHREFAIYVLSSFPGIGPELAGRIFDRFGRLPLRLDVDREELLAVEGLGERKVNALIRALEVKGEGWL